MSEQGKVTTLARTPDKDVKDLTVFEMLSDPRVKKAMLDTVPKHFSPDRLMRVAVQAVRKTPKLGECDTLSLLGALITCASLGLEPNTPLGQCYLIPFEKRRKGSGGHWETERVDVNVIVGYRGLIDLARRSGDLISIHADVVYEGDDFSFEYGTNTHLTHRPAATPRADRKPTHAYAFAKVKDGQAFEVLPYDQVLEIRNATQAYKQALDQRSKNDKRWQTTPWIAFEHEMAAKTMVRRLAKWLPMSIELLEQASALDSLAEIGRLDFRAIAGNPDLAKSPYLAITEEEETESDVVTPNTPKGSEFAHAQPGNATPPAQAEPANTKPAAAVQMPAQEMSREDPAPEESNQQEVGGAEGQSTEEWLADMEQIVAATTDLGELVQFFSDIAGGLQSRQLTERWVNACADRLEKIAPAALGTVTRLPALLDLKNEIMPKVAASKRISDHLEKLFAARKTKLIRTPPGPQ